MKKYGSMLLIGLLCLCMTLLVSFTVYGEESLPAQNGAGRLTVVFHTEDTTPEPIVGDAFHLFFVADLDEDYNFILTEAFADSRVSLEDLEDSALANTLAAFAEANELTAIQSGETNEDGRVVFDALENGLYLVIGEPLTQDYVTYVPAPFLVPIPSADGSDLTMEPKRDRFELDRPVDRRVLKIWEDDGNEADRPEEIIVQLLRDGEVYEEVTLNAENNWRYAWDQLEGGHNWQVNEKNVPEGYTVKVEQQGITFTITNTRGKTPPPPSSSEETLPQTGMLWWPVPFLLVAGVVFFLLGVLVLRIRRRNDA